MVIFQGDLLVITRGYLKNPCQITMFKGQIHYFNGRGLHSKLLAYQMVPSGNQTWLAGKWTIYQRFSYLETSIHNGFSIANC